MSDLPTLARFRELRDFYQAQRRLNVLPTLNAAKVALGQQLGVLYKQHARASKHDKAIIENNMRPLQWEYQYIAGQVAVIESWLPSCPAHLRAAVFDVSAVAGSGEAGSGEAERVKCENYV